MKVKRFLVFSAMDYEARGGWGDLRGQFDTEVEAKAAVANSIAATDEEYPYHRFQLIDLETGDWIETDGPEAGSDKSRVGQWVKGGL